MTHAPRGPSAHVFTPDQRLRVFVSSTLEELADERAAARAAIERLRLTPVMFELGARPHAPRTLYRAYLEQSQVFVGLYWQRYGWIAPGEDISGLEDELRLAGARPKLLYVKRPAADREPRLDELLRRVEDDGTVSYKVFESAAELRELLENDLALLLTERFAERRATDPVASGPLPLPSPASSLVGRRHEVAALTRTLLAEDVRLVTLLGPGGIGKTRLALAVGEALRDAFADGVRFVALADVHDPQRVFDAVAGALGVTLEGGSVPLDAVTAHVRGQDTLLIFDNVEQVVEVAGDLAELLRGAPGLKLLVTSRAALRLTGERLHSVEPLGLPVASAVDGDAVELFLQRAGAVRSDLEANADELAAVAAIVRRLDGLPLAIELAASRVRLLSPRQLASRLERSLDLPGRGPRDLPDRQRTLHATLDWSFRLLSPGEQRLFAHLGVFVGGFTLDAALAVAGDDMDEAGVFDALNALVDHCLVRATPSEADPRFGMLQTVREYALERLEVADERDDVRARHARHFLELAERFGPRTKLEQRRSSAILVAERPNVAQAIEWCLEVGRFTDVVRFGWALWLFWWIHNDQERALPWLDRVLGAPLDERDAMLAQTVAGALHVRRGDADQAATLFEGALAGARSRDDADLEALVHCGLGMVELARLQVERSEGHFDAALRLFRARTDAWGIAFAHVALARVALARGAIERAIALTGPLVEPTRRSGDENTAAWILHVKGIAELEARAWASASRDLADSLDLFWRLGNLAGAAHVIGSIAVLSLATGDPARAARLAGAAAAMATAVGALPFQPERSIFEAGVETLRAQLGEDFAAREAEGRALTAGDAIGEARAWLAPLAVA